MMSLTSYTADVTKMPRAGRENPGPLDHWQQVYTFERSRRGVKLPTHAGLTLSDQVSVAVDRQCLLILQKRGEDGSTMYLFLEEVGTRSKPDQKIMFGTFEEVMRVMQCNSNVS